MHSLTRKSFLTYVYDTHNKWEPYGSYLYMILDC